MLAKSDDCRQFGLSIYSLNDLKCLSHALLLQKMFDKPCWKNVLVYLAWHPYNVVNIERLLPFRVHHFICLLGTRIVCLNYLSDNLIHCRPVFFNTLQVRS